MNVSPDGTTSSRIRRLGRGPILTNVVDAALLFGLLKAGVTAGTAGIVSLPVAVVLSHLVRERRVQRQEPIALFAVNVALAVFLRGGVLAWMERIPKCPVIVMAAAAAVAGGLVLWAAAAVDWNARETGDKRIPIWRRPVPALLIYAVLLRLVYLGLPELIHEEAYYWNYSRHLALGYLDHPPMVAWLIRAFTAVLGHTELGVRAGAFVAWMVGAWFLFGLTRRIYDAAAAVCSVLLFAVLPFFFANGLAMTPDAPLTACWAATLYFFYRALVDETPTAWWGVGVFLGLGMLSKYSVVLLGFAVLAFMLLDRRARSLFLRPWPWLAAAGALLLFSPVIVWNSQHQWMSFAFQSSRRATAGFEFDFPILLRNVAILLTPVGMGAVAVVAFSRELLAASGDANHDDRFLRGFRLLMLSAMLPLAVFVFFSLFRQTKLNWTGPLWIGALPFMGHMMAAGWPVNAGRLREWCSPRTWRNTAVVTLLLFGAGMYQLTLGLPGLRYPQNRLGSGWPELAAKIEDTVEEVQRETGVRPLVVGMDGDRLSSWLAFYRSRAMARDGKKNTGAAALDTAGPNLFGRTLSHMYGFWFPTIEKYTDRPAVLVGNKRQQLEVDLAQRRAGPIRELSAGKNGQPTWHVYYRVVARKGAPL